MRGLGALLASGLLLAACGQDDKPNPTATGATPAASGRQIVAAGDAVKGRQIWLAQCVACHNSDPSKAGAVGPAVKGALPELVEGKLLRGVYPPGYTPKRPTNIMPQRPDLAASVPDLAAFLR